MLLALVLLSMMVRAAKLNDKQSGSIAMESVSFDDLTLSFSGNRAVPAICVFTTAPVGQLTLSETMR
jgi:hypothetical protein